MGSPPKPWELAGSGSVSAPSVASSVAPSTASTTLPAASAASSLSSTSTATPTLPDRPAAFSTPATPFSTALTQPGGFGSTYSSYGSPYGGFGTGYSPYGGGYGSYGGFGSYGGMGGMGGMYGGYGGFPGAYNGGMGPSLASGTQQGFALLHAVVQTVSGVAQMLESTFMATHASFTALVGVAEHFAHLRDALGSVLGLFGLLNWLRDLIRGRRHAGPLQREFQHFASGQPPPPPPASKKPLLMFLAAALGVPWALSRLVRLLAERSQQNALPPLAPSDLTFARAIHAFNPQSPAELALQPETLVAITGRLDPRTGAEVDPRVPLVDENGKEIEAEWWKGRTRDGREGWFPSRWVQILERRDQTKVVPENPAQPPVATEQVKKVD